MFMSRGGNHVRNRDFGFRQISLTAFLIALVFQGSVQPATAQTPSSLPATLDRLALYASRIESNPGFDRADLYGVSRNLVAFADRWPMIRDRLVNAAAYSSSSDPLTFVSGAGGKPVSTPTLNVSRFAGFTQSQTSTAWCGSSVITFFNDTGSEARTMAALSGITAVGFATSFDRGRGFAYQGAPPGGVNLAQVVLGSPTVACADQSTFFYSAIWLDTLNQVTGVAFAHSSDAGHTFLSPAVAVGKSAATHFVDHDWLAIDPFHSMMYIAYADLDYSGTVCGTDPGTGSAIPRHAIELVTSTDGGRTWSSSSTIVDQVCADTSKPLAAVIGPQVAVGPAGEVYVAYEAAGESGDASSRQIKVARSNNAGLSFGPSVVVAAVTAVGDGADLQGFVRANEFPTMAIGKGKKDAGFIYIAWNEGDNQVPDALTTLKTYEFANIKMTVSQDGGATWKAPTLVNNNPKGGGSPLTDQFEPAIAADKTGSVAICFYDRRRDANNFRIDRECAKSRDSGATWTNRRITATSFPTEVGQDLLVAPDYMGDFDTVATDSTNQEAGFLDAYANNAAGNPNIMNDQP
jgi:hypothetical protein